MMAESYSTPSLSVSVTYHVRSYMHRHIHLFHSSTSAYQWYLGADDIQLWKRHDQRKYENERTLYLVLHSHLTLNNECIIVILNRQGGIHSWLETVDIQIRHCNNIANIFSQPLCNTQTMISMTKCVWIEYWWFDTILSLPWLWSLHKRLWKNLCLIQFSRSMTLAVYSAAIVHKRIGTNSWLLKLNISTRYRWQVISIATNKDEWIKWNGIIELIKQWNKAYVIPIHLQRIQIQDSIHATCA